MSLHDLHWSTIHASAFTQGSGLLRWVEGTPRTNGALRYRCPLTGSLVLVTDEPTLARLAHGRARVRCADCREQHLVTVAANDTDLIVASPDKP